MNNWKFVSETPKHPDEQGNEPGSASQTRGPTGLEWKSRTARVFPQINLSQTETAFLVEAPVPGVNPADLNVQVEGNLLTISGRRPVAQPGQTSWHRHERRTGRFSRMFELPGMVESTAIKAEIRDGILHLLLPRAAAEQPRQIEVRIG
ncbi:MAG TPA: Hsp20/alpha crystallin family protein [Candidatus Ozemobacteraceae bacterium]|nr:Hsp20/alpha crystallin family protein [Candidatus Ozemobacteraceae bacterium]